MYISGTPSYTMAIVYNNATANSQTIGNAGQVWQDVSHPQWGLDPLYINLDRSDNRLAIKEFVRTAKITSVPTVLFLKVEESKTGQVIVTRLSGANSYQKIYNTVRSILRGEFKGPGSGNDDGLVPGGNGGNPWGLFNIKLPKVAWLLAGIVATGKTLDSKSKLGQVGYGTASAYAWKKYLE